MKGRTTPRRQSRYPLYGPVPNGGEAATAIGAWVGEALSSRRWLRAVNSAGSPVLGDQRDSYTEQQRYHDAIEAAVVEATVGVNAEADSDEGGRNAQQQ